MTDEERSIIELQRAATYAAIKELRRSMSELELCIAALEDAFEPNIPKPPPAAKVKKRMNSRSDVSKMQSRHLRYL